MTIKKTVQMIALSSVLAVGVSGYAMARSFTTDELLSMSENLTTSDSDEYREALEKSIEANDFVIFFQRMIDEGENVETHKSSKANWLARKSAADKTLSKYHN